MPAPVFPIVLALSGVASLGYGLLSRKDGSSSSPSSPSSRGGGGGGGGGGGLMIEPPTPGPDGLNRGTPPDLANAAQQMLKYGTDPAAMEQMASVMEQYGYADIASQLRARAAELRAAPPAPAPIPNVFPPTPPPPPAPVPPPSPTGQKALVTGTSVNLRSQPTTGASSLGMLNTPEVVSVLNWNAGSANGYEWAHVATSIGTGYMAKNFLRLADGNLPNVIPPSPTPSADITATVTGSGVNVRLGNSTSAQSLGMVSSPEVVKVLNWNAGSSGGYDWAQVSTSRGTGYMAKTYLRLNAPTPPAISGEEAYVTVISGDPLDVRIGKVLAPSGCKLRASPNARSPFKAYVGYGEDVQIVKQLPGPKADHLSPGPGGWSFVRTSDNAGWLPSEWLS